MGNNSSANGAAEGGGVAATNGKTQQKQRKTKQGKDRAGSVESTGGGGGEKQESVAANAGEQAEQQQQQLQQPATELTEKEKRRKELIEMRRYSMPSVEMLSSLHEYDLALSLLEQEANAFEQRIAFLQSQESLQDFKDELLKTKNRLALCLGEAHTLQCKKIDGVQSVDLNTGKDEVKAGRKDLNRRAETLADLIESLHKATVQLIEMDIL